PGDRCADREGPRRRQPRRPHDLVPRARPGDPLGPLLGSTLVQARALARLLGRVQPAGDKTALRARRSRDLVVRPRQGGETRARIAPIFYSQPGMARPRTRATARLPRPTRVFAM